jgi:hypothetical protein
MSDNMNNEIKIKKSIRVSIIDKLQRKSVKFKTFPINFNIIPYYQETEKRKMDRKLIENSHKVFKNEIEGIYKDKYLTVMFNELYHNDKNYIQKRKILSKSLSLSKKNNKNPFPNINKNNNNIKIYNYNNINNNNIKRNNNNILLNINKISKNNNTVNNIPKNFPKNKNVNKYKINFNKNKPKLLKKNLSEYNLNKNKLKLFPNPLKIYFQ